MKRAAAQVRQELLRALADRRRSHFGPQVQQDIENRIKAATSAAQQILEIEHDEELSAAVDRVL